MSDDYTRLVRHGDSEGKWHTRCVIYDNRYGRTVQKIEAMMAAAKRDFPSLSSGEVEIVIFAGQRIAKLMGIEFNAPPGRIPASYEVVRELESIV